MAFWHLKKGKCQKILAVLCDGIGGLEQGEQASSYVVRQLVNWFMTEGYRLNQKKQQKILQQLCFQTHLELQNYGKENSIHLGTTIAVVLVENRKISWFYTGDCRIYLLKRRRVKKLTKEHHDEHGNLTRAIGVGEWHLLSGASKRFGKRDRILLCSDGFYRNLETEELRMWNKKTVESSSMAERMLRQIFHKKVTMGEKDNISALYFGYAEGEIE